MTRSAPFCTQDEGHDMNFLEKDTSSKIPWGEGMNDPSPKEERGKESGYRRIAGWDKSFKI